ncbi:hypothetical protein C4D60_Mb10t11760 [Musa balbisiana]|uniref:Uncharacterized protein n=1 Tax=Musa balbisiana TaxID=52838 RepID=A0A4S8IXA2_MUSBA|nr:hypothetical protein C4D60_Mb10t11760 [Musa balbisiana]
MAKPSVSLQNIKDFWNSQVNDEANWAVNSVLGRDKARAPRVWTRQCASMRHRLGAHSNHVSCASSEHPKLLRATCLFAGSIFIMRNFGNLMAV